jgi:hypothetical protein
MICQDKETCSTRSSLLTNKLTVSGDHIESVVPKFLSPAASELIVLREEKDLGHELAELAKLEVEFRNEFSNVLCVETKLVLLHNLHNDMKTATVKMDYDLEFLVS